MKHRIFQGTATALITPMTPAGVDFETLGRLIDFQLESGVNALVPVGTTGESATLTAQERGEVIRFTIRRVSGRVPVIAGTGTNSTAQAVEHTRAACGEGADGVLVVTPYYNKATQAGLIAHYTAIADASDKPVVLYNVPGRTGCNLLPDTVSVLADHPRVAAVKEASGNIGQIVELFAKCGDRVDVYSGEDGITLPILAMGGAGCISVLSNVAPKQTVAMTDAFFAGDLKTAAGLQCRLLPLIRCLFSEVNPIPVKAAAAALGFGEGYLRLPLTPLEEAKRATLLTEMRKLGILS